MPQSLSCLLTHVVFSTKNRQPWLTHQISTELHPYLVGVLKNLECPSIQVGGVSDHVHLFFRLSRTKTVAAVVETVKTSSSKWIKGKWPEWGEFHWQTGYAAFSVSPSSSEQLIEYIRNQEAHHQTVSFQAEYIRFLKRYHVEYSDTYMWD